MKMNMIVTTTAMTLQMKLVPHGIWPPTLTQRLKLTQLIRRKNIGNQDKHYAICFRNGLSRVVLLQSTLDECGPGKYAYIPAATLRKKQTTSHDLFTQFEIHVVQITERQRTADWFLLRRFRVTGTGAAKVWRFASTMPVVNKHVAIVLALLKLHFNGTDDAASSDYTDDDDDALEGPTHHSIATTGDEASTRHSVATHSDGAESEGAVASTGHAVATSFPPGHDLPVIANIHVLQNELQIESTNCDGDNNMSKSAVSENTADLIDTIHGGVIYDDELIRKLTMPNLRLLAKANNVETKKRRKTELRDDLLLLLHTTGALNPPQQQRENTRINATSTHQRQRGTDATRQLESHPLLVLLTKTWFMRPNRGNEDSKIGLANEANIEKMIPTFFRRHVPTIDVQHIKEYGLLCLRQCHFGAFSPDGIIVATEGNISFLALLEMKTKCKLTTVAPEV